jgi:TPR repeat protein
MSASEVPPVSSLEEKKATTEAPIVLVDIDLTTGYPISEDSKIISPKLLAEKYCSKEILESLKKAVIAGDQQAAALLLALSWHVLPPQQASASVDLITGKKEKNALTCYYLALFFNAGFGVERDQRIAANFLLESYKGGCQIAGYEFCDILYFTKTQSAEMFNMWKNLMKDPLSQEYLARIGIFEFYGIFTEKNESTGLLKINNAAKNGVKFANYELALKSRLRMELQTATPLAKAALFENNLNSYVLYGDLLLNNGDEDAALLLFYQAARKMNPNGWKRLATYFKWKKEYVEYTKLIFLIELERSANEKFTGRKEEPKEFVEALKEVQK